MKIAFTERLRMLVSERKLTREEFCKQVGINIHSLRHYETSTENVMPPYLLLIDIATYFNVTLDFLVGRSDERNTKCAALKYSQKDKLKAVLADRLKTLRLRRGFTQRFIAKELDFPIRQYQTYESPASTKIPRFNNLIKIADYLNCTLDYLFGLKSEEV